MIIAENLTKRFDGIIAVDTLSFEVREGEVLGLLGPNGAGKTTTVRMLAALIAPTSGSARVCGVELGRGDESIRSQMGFVTEAPGLYESLSARRNLEIFARLCGVADASGQAEKYLRMLDLWERRNEPTGMFSKGMKQKLVIARALLHEPKLLFLDEPTSGLDPQMTKIVRDFIERLHRDGRTILLCTHNLDEAERLCDRVAVIRTRLIAIDRPASLRSRLFGHHTIIRLRKIDEGMLAAVRSLGIVREVHVSDSTLLVGLANPEEANPMIVRALVDAGAEVCSVSEQTHSLEDIYLKLLQEDQP